ncbi:hypothetical protein SAMN05421737_101277 [Shouchella lonarensis]|uniref:Sporulation protein YhaL n=2 Tax=Shouchella lonarensis TaxID=1464122 RepID=A0A1G6GMW0_9BACI|nr:hypothetical protein SAMN05421737_101277 [Shouchella lonarensis]
MKIRALMCLFFAIVMVVYAWDRLPLNGQGLEKVFALSWLSFAGLVIGGNIVAIARRGRKSTQAKQEVDNARAVKRARQFG